MLSLDDQKFVVTDDNRLPKQKRIPPFNILTIKISDVNVGLYGGAASLTFFNDRLMEVRFFPDNVDGFLQTIDGLSKSENVDIKPFTRVWFYQDFEDKKYIGWIDYRLQQQVDTWIRNYS